MDKVCYYLAPNQINDLKKLSQLKSVSMGALIRIAVSEYIKKEIKNA